MANIFYRNTKVRIATELFDSSNQLTGVNTSDILFYLRYPNNIVHSNDTDIGLKISGAQYDSGIAVSAPSLGNYYIDYVFSQVGDYKFKFQVNSSGVGGTTVITAVAGAVSILDDGVF